MKKILIISALLMAASTYTSALLQSTKPRGIRLTSDSGHRLVDKARNMQTMFMSNLIFQEREIDDTDDLILVGCKDKLENDQIFTSIPGLSSSKETGGNNLTKLQIKSMLKSIKGSGKATTYLTDKRCTIVVLPDKKKISRNNHLLSPHFLTESLAGIKGDNVQIYVVDEEIERNIGAISSSIARAFPLYNAKSDKKDDDVSVSVSFLNKNYLPISDKNLWKGANAVSGGVRLAARLGDMPPAELTTERYAQECKKIADDLGTSVKIEEITGEDLQQKGYGGIYGVGKAAEVPPRMIIMTYTPDVAIEDCESIALVGKGVVYDTGGLSLKGKEGMPGMKHDMGGSAGVLAGFKAAVQLKVPTKITLILGIAENAIGPKALRNDDILKMYSGKTVEINNTDAEGRLILGDCVCHASRNIPELDIILDMATLTGAQLICTGKKHAGILAKSAQLEKRLLEVGLSSGDLVYPMLYAPELLKAEFSSKVADMKNSVKDRGNAQSSCAGHFIETHLDSEYAGDWVHVDMAGPDTKNDRATGYGVALVLGLVGADGF
mmetsp:Transcript_23394/g.35567  ORF Transcript_23394/g.35567 Transcript_23394/m.35567 type:complete len:551 (-) Transcript_23394:102-1754(-)